MYNNYTPLQQRQLAPEDGIPRQLLAHTASEDPAASAGTMRFITSPEASLG